MQFLSQEIKSELAKGDLKSAIEVLYSVLSPASTLSAKAQSLYSRYTELNALVEKDLVHTDFAHIEENRITSDLVSLLHELTKKDLKEKINVRIHLKEDITEAQKEKLLKQVLSGNYS